jgi:hypothetical protein
MPSEYGGGKPLCPDFVIVRRDGGAYAVDLLEPRNDGRLDTWAKTKGLAESAEDHHLDFRQLIVSPKTSGLPTDSRGEKARGAVTSPEHRHSTASLGSSRASLLGPMRSPACMASFATAQEA